MVFLKLFSKSALGIILSVFCLLNFSSPTALANSESTVERVDSELLADAVRVAEEIDSMRSALASAIDSEEMEVDRETFSMVCKPVGMRAKKIAKEKGWEFRQLALKYRNPKNKADPQAVKAMEKFEGDSGLQGFWSRDARVGKKGFRYFKRITVEPACLACHGNKGKRPDFIKSKYPDDRAFGFASGDLRGVYGISFKQSD
jgi:hypothetical protein